MESTQGSSSSSELPAFTPLTLEQGELREAFLKEMAIIDWTIRDPRDEEKMVMRDAPPDDPRTPEQLIVDAMLAYQNYQNSCDPAQRLHTTLQDILSQVHGLRRTQLRRAQINEYRKMIAEIDAKHAEESETVHLQDH